MIVLPDKNLQNKKDSLIYFAKSVLNSPQYSKEINQLILACGYKKDRIIQGFVEYNLDIFSHGNEVYNLDVMRMVLHMHNLLEGSWHIERQRLACDLINLISPKKAINLGFGVPALHAKLLLSKQVKLILCDIAQPAFYFAEQLIKLWDPQFLSLVSYLQADLANVKECIEGEYDLYISLHSIEHVPEATLRMKEYVEYSRPDAYFLMEIPIGPITPEHTIKWDNFKEAINWLEKSGLEVLKAHYIKVNPKVDLFAEQHNFNYGSCLALCKK